MKIEWNHFDGLNEGWLSKLFEIRSKIVLRRLWLCDALSNDGTEYEFHNFDPPYKKKGSRKNVELSELHEKFENLEFSTFYLKIYQFVTPFTLILSLSLSK